MYDVTLMPCNGAGPSGRAVEDALLSDCLNSRIVDSNPSRGVDILSMFQRVVLSCVGRELAMGRSPI